MNEEKIKEIIINTLTGNIYIITHNNRRKRVLNKDEYGYFLKDKNLVDRITHETDLKRLREVLN